MAVSASFWGWRQSATSSGLDSLSVSTFRGPWAHSPTNNHDSNRLEENFTLPFPAVETSHKRGIVSRLMQNLIRISLAHVLGVLAIASIAAGPSPAAAAAEMTARVKRDRAADQSSNPSDKSSNENAASDVVASFVAPASAKPADVHNVGPALGALYPCRTTSAASTWFEIDSSESFRLPRQTKRLPNQPNAPPRA